MREILVFSIKPCEFDTLIFNFKSLNWSWTTIKFHLEQINLSRILIGNRFWEPRNWTKCFPSLSRMHNQTQRPRCLCLCCGSNLATWGKNQLWCYSVYPNWITKEKKSFSHSWLWFELQECRIWSWSISNRLVWQCSVLSCWFSFTFGMGNWSLVSLLQ